MGCRVQVKGMTEPTDKSEKMFKLKEACDQADTSYPEELVEYFKGTDVLEYLPPYDRQ